MDRIASEPLKSADGLVLDMRGRWGGAPADAADIFVGKAPLVEWIDRQGRAEVANARWRKPMVGIIDEGSRSGMEILAHGLKQAGVPLIGTKTAGAVVAGRAFRLTDNSLLLLAVADVRVDGERLEGAGVAPDIEVPYALPYAAGADPQLDRAVEETEAHAGGLKLGACGLAAYDEVVTTVDWSCPNGGTSIPPAETGRLATPTPARPDHPGGMSPCA